MFFCSFNPTLVASAALTQFICRVCAFSPRFPLATMRATLLLPSMLQRLVFSTCFSGLQPCSILELLHLFDRTGWTLQLCPVCPYVSWLPSQNVLTIQFRCKRLTRATSPYSTKTCHRSDPSFSRSIREVGCNYLRLSVWSVAKACVPPNSCKYDSCIQNCRRPLSQCSHICSHPWTSFEGGSQRILQHHLQTFHDSATAK